MRLKHLVPPQELDDVLSPVLLKLESFELLTESDRRLVQQLLDSDRAVPTRTDLVCEGQDTTYVHLVTSGFACRYKLLSRGRRQIVAYLVPGDFCDINGFILKTMDHSICTLAPSRIAFIPKEAVHALLASPSLAKALFRAALVDAATLREWVTNVGRRRAEHRIAHLFCEISARLRAVGLVSGVGVALPISQAELADTVGLSLVQTNRSLQSLREKGLITFRSGELEILDAGRLADECGFTPNYLHLTSCF